MWCWSLPEIVTLSYEASDLSREVWVVVFLLPLGTCFLSASCMIVLNCLTAVFNVSVSGEVHEFKLCFCFCREPLPVCSFVVVVCVFG